MKIIKIVYKYKIDVKGFIENHKDFIINKRLILRLQQRLKSERHKIFTKKNNKIAESSNDDKTIQSIYSIEPWIKRCNTSERITKCDNIIKQHKNEWLL